MTVPTSDDLARARRWLGIVYEDADFPDPKARPASLPHDEDRKTCIQALEAYERVGVLLERWETQVRMETANRQTQLMAGDLHLALYGED